MVGFINNSSVLLNTFIFMVNQSFIQQEDSYNYYYMQIGRETNASKCYGSYGCFQLAPPWTSETRPIALFPEDSSQVDPKFPVYTRSNPTKPFYLDLNEFSYLESSGIAFDKPLYLVTHGYLEGGTIKWINNLAQILLQQEDCTVILIDWEAGSHPPYTQAVANIRLVAVIAAHLLNDIARHTKRKNLDDVHCIGHSLGAHMCGYIGYTMQEEFKLTLGRISGLDPAEPHFSKTDRPVRLDRSAAKYVDVIHTDANPFIKGGLGIRENIGHVDYYPNGGSTQPGCTKGFLQYVKEANGSFVAGFKKYTSCNHVRSHQYFIESLVPNQKCRFLTISCPSYTDFLSGKCFDCGKHGENCLTFGFHGRKHYERFFGKKWKQTSRVQYLLTGEDPPYCKGHYRISVQMSRSDESVKHAGEIGQLLFTMHSTTDGKGEKSTPVGFRNGFYQPGASYTEIVGTDEVPDLRAIEIEWKHNSSFFNPLTWRLLSPAKIYLNNVTVDSLELNKKLTVCPKNNKPLINGTPQLLLSSYC